MSPLAEILLRQGVKVSGSDVKASAVTAHLESLGLVFYQGHAPSHVGRVDAVVRSSAVRTTNPEIAEAERRGIPVLLRGQLLADLMAPLGPAWGPYADQTHLALALHAERELVHHGAEVALLRDLYAAMRPG